MPTPTYFFFTQCDEASLFGALSILEEVGLPLIQVIPAMIPLGSGKLVGGNGQPHAIMGYKVLTKCDAETFGEKMEMLKKYKPEDFLSRGPDGLLQRAREKGAMPQGGAEEKGTGKIIGFPKRDS